MAAEPITNLNGGVEPITLDVLDKLPIADVSDTTQAPTGTTKPVSLSKLVTFFDANLSFLTTETDPVFSASPAANVVDNLSNTVFLSGDGTYQSAGADGNGIYDGSGSLSGATTVTMAGNDLTFGTGANVKFNDNTIVFGSDKGYYLDDVGGAESGRFWSNGGQGKLHLGGWLSGGLRGQVALNTSGNSPWITWSTTSGTVATTEMFIGSFVNTDNSGGYGLRTENKNFALNTGAGGGTSAFRVLSGNGNVGIGIASPSAKLHVAGDTQIDGTIFVNNSGTNTIGTGTGSPRIDMRGDVNTSLNLYDGANRLALIGTNNGNGGILNLYNSAGVLKTTLKDGDSNFINKLIVGNITGSNAGHLSIYGTGNTSATTALIVYDSGGVNNLLRVRDDGRIGIGVGSPSAKLHLAGDSRFDGEVLVNLPLGGNLTVNGDTASNKLFVNNTGVGVGTSTLGGSLFVVSDSLATTLAKFSGGLGTMLEVRNGSVRMPSIQSLSIGATSNSGWFGYINSPTNNNILKVAKAGVNVFEVKNTGVEIIGGLRIQDTTTISATAGTNGDVPAQVDGYLTININGTDKKIPYYAV